MTGATRTAYIFLIYTMLLAGMISFGCSTSDNGSTWEDSTPFPTQEVSGIWGGGFGSEFAIGIITEDNEARFVGDYSQYVGDSGALTVKANSAIFSGDLDKLTNDSSTIYTSNAETLTMTGWAAGGETLWGSLRYEESSQPGSFAFYDMNDSYQVSPDVGDLSGQWEIEDALVDDNTFALTITSTSNTTTGAISGQDEIGNTLSGTISIHYSQEDPTPYNVYDVSLTLNNSQTLTGLATYVIEMDVEEITIANKTLVIGASNSQYSFGGLGTQP